jgi:hypothetical protein
MLMKRFLALAIGTAAAVMVLAGPALAKGPAEEVFGQLLIAGPGLSASIEIKGLVSFGPYGEQRGASDSRVNDLSAFVLGSGLIPSDKGYFGLEPAGALGPKYVVTASIDEPGSAIVHQDLYPYAEAGPVFYNPPGQESLFGNRLASAWWYPPPGFLSILTANGLPLKPPALPAPAIRKGPAPAPLPSGSMIWIAVGVIGALTLLLVGGAVAGRQRSVRAM